MWPSVFALSAVAMVTLWIVAGFCSRKRARVSRQLAFLFGTFVVWPALGFALFVLLGEVVFEGIEGKAVGGGLAVIGLIALAGIGTLVTWLVGFWLGSAVGWWFARKQIGI